MGGLDGWKDVWMGSELVVYDMCDMCTSIHAHHGYTYDSLPLSLSLSLSLSVYIYHISYIIYHIYIQYTYI